MNFSIAKFSILVFSFKFVNARLRVFEKKEDVMRFAYQNVVLEKGSNFVCVLEIANMRFSDNENEADCDINKL